MFAYRLIPKAVSLFCFGALLACSGGGGSTESFPASAAHDAGAAADPSADDTAATRAAFARGVQPATTNDSCNATTPCVSGLNGGTGPGVFGKSVSGRGISGSTTFVSTSQTKFMSGVFGVDLSTSGIYNAGVYGNSARGIGVYGVTSGRYGVYGNSTGVGDGVYGNATNTVGVYGNATGGFGVVGNSNNQGVNGTGGNYGVNGTSDSGVGAYGATSTGAGLEGSAASGHPLMLTDALGNTLAYSDTSGNFFIHGSYGTFAQVGGATVVRYIPTASRPAVEDVGTGHLIRGSAVVQLDPSVVRGIDSSRSYQVFLTPDGDTHGLYVASKSASSFVVREVEDGRGTFDFDYHVYATAVGAASSLVPKAPPAPRPAPKP